MAILKAKTGCGVSFDAHVAAQQHWNSGHVCTSVKPFQHSYTINQLTNKPTILEFNSFYQENSISNLHLQKQGIVKTPTLVIAPYDQSSKLWTSEFPSRHQVRIAPSRQFSPTSTCLQRRRGRGKFPDGNRMPANL